MTKLTLERTLVYRGEDGELTRYEILRTDGNPANNIDSILVYREKVVDGEKTWVRTDHEVSLEHLGPSHGGGFPQSVQMSTRGSRDIASAVNECNEHWSKYYG